MDSIGKKIRALRKKQNLTQTELANILSVSSQSVSKWENDISLPDISILPVIARFFNITMDELFDYKLESLNYRERFIRFMAENNVLQFGEFKLNSERISPYYIDISNFKTASQISKLGELFSECIIEQKIESNVLLSNTLKEMPIMISACTTLYNKYGIETTFISSEGTRHVKENNRITIIKDTLTSGNSIDTVLNSCDEFIRNKVSDIIVAVDRKERSTQTELTAKTAIENKYGVQIHSIVNIDDIIRAIENGIINGAEYLYAIKKYRNYYGGKLIEN